MSVTMTSSGFLAWLGSSLALPSTYLTFSTCTIHKITSRYSYCTVESTNPRGWAEMIQSDIQGMALLPVGFGAGREGWTTVKSFFTSQVYGTEYGVERTVLYYIYCTVQVRSYGTHSKYGVHSNVSSIAACRRQ